MTKAIRVRNDAYTIRNIEISLQTFAGIYSHTHTPKHRHTDVNLHIHYKLYIQFVISSCFVFFFMFACFVSSFLELKVLNTHFLYINIKLQIPNSTYDFSTFK